MTPAWPGGRLLVCAASERGLAAVRGLAAGRPEVPLAVCALAEASVVHSFDDDIRAEAARAGAELLPWDDVRSGAALGGVRGALFAAWPRMLPAAAAASLGGRVVVLHDSLLPRHRGFAPVATAILCGDRETGLTALTAGGEPDTGDILWQRSVPIDPADRVADVFARLLPLYAEAGCAAADRIARGDLSGTPQDASRATWSIWRDEEDLFVDWNRSAAEIARAVRALGPPFLGARCRLDGAVVVLRDVAEVPDRAFSIRQPGKVWDLTPAGEPSVVCGSGMLRILAADVHGAAEHAGPLVPMRRLRVRFR